MGRAGDTLLVRTGGGRMVYIDNIYWGMLIFPLIAAAITHSHYQRRKLTKLTETEVQFTVLENN